MHVNLTGYRGCTCVACVRISCHVYRTIPTTSINRRREKRRESASSVVVRRRVTSDKKVKASKPDARVRACVAKQNGGMP